MKTMLRRFALGVPLVAAGLFAGLAVPSLGGGSLHGLPRPERDLAQAQRIAGFRLQLPAWLPGGATLERVSWPDQIPGTENTGTAVDVWYRLVNGNRVHIWQTNGPALEKNPVGRGDEFRVGETTWWREYTGLGLALTARSRDGITLQVTARLPSDVLERIARSFGI